MRASIVVTSCAGLAAGATLVALGSAQGSPESTGARLALDWFADTDVAGFHLRIDRVPCHGRDRGRRPGPSVLSSTFSFDDAHLDPTTRHRATELFVGLEPGCYEVLAVPASELSGATWTASADCARAGSGRLKVARGRASVASLLPQCVGDRHGHRDVIARLNRPPELAVDPVRACATATDPDDDPVAVSFRGPDGLAIGAGPPEVVAFEGDRRVWRACADLPAERAEREGYEVRAEAHDLGWSLGRQVRLEELVAPASSSAAVTFRVGCAEQPCS